MKILFPIGFFHPNQNGPGNSVYWLAKSLIRNNINVVEIAMDKDIPFSIPRNQWLYLDYGKVKYVKTRNYVLGIKYIWHSFIESKNAEIVHLNSIFAPTSLTICTLITFFRRNTHIVWSTRGELAPHALAIKSPIKKIILFFIRVLLNRHIAFHATSEREKKYIQYFFGENIAVIQIPNLIEIPIYYPNPKEKYILYLGRIHQIKALEELIYAVNLSSSIITENFKLYISGDANNEYGEKLKQIVRNLDLQNHINFIGFIQGEAKEHLLSSAYCLVLPSHSENFGNVVVEALAQKTPVIASNGTPWQILETSNAGFWVENTPEKLASAIDCMLDMPEPDYKRMCENAFDLVTSEFEIEHNVYRWIDAYETLINK